MKKRAHVSGQSPVLFLAIALAGPPVALAGGFCPNFPSYIPVWSMTYNNHVLCFVGSDPRNGPLTTTIPTIVIPVELRYLDAKGKVVETSDPTGPLFTNPGISAMDAVLASPIFAAQDFKFGDTDVGTVQWIEATEKASFWNYPGAKFHDWHITMLGFPSRRLTLDVPYGDWQTSSVPHFHLVTNALIDDFIKDLLPDYETSLPIFLFYNMGEHGFEGYHRRFRHPDGIYSSYIFAAYMDPPAWNSDLRFLSHEVAEFAHDPFDNNSAPWPILVTLPWDPPYVFTTADCYSLLEVGDPLEHRNHAQSDFPIDGFIKYNFQNEVTASWFMHASPSFSVNGWYTLKGAVDGEFAAPAPACPTVQ